jgi:ATP/ADP translocase
MLDQIFNLFINMTLSFDKFMTDKFMTDKFMTDTFMDDYHFMNDQFMDDYQQFIPNISLSSESSDISSSSFTESLYENHHNFDIQNEVEFVQSLTDMYNIILLALVWILICILLECVISICLNHYQKKNTGGRYRYICSGKSLNNKRCKRRVKNSNLCFHHQK